MSVPIEAKKTEASHKTGLGISNCFAVTSSYLPTRFPRFNYDTGKYGVVTVNGFGLGVDYNLTVPTPLLGWSFRTGLGYTFSRIDESKKERIVDYSISSVGTDISSPLSIDAFHETQREYSYVYIPVAIGYQLFSRGTFSINTFLGMRGKFNIGYIEKESVESATWLDHYFVLFDKSSVKSEATRFIIQGEAGVELEYNKLFLSLCFLKDTDRMYKKAYIEKERKHYEVSYQGPYTFNCWQLGLGIKF